MQNKYQNNRGFTLVEILVSVAIIAVLVGISIPIFSKRLEQAKQAVDLTNMRAAYAAALVEWMNTGSVGGDTLWYYDGSKIVTKSTGIKGYGKSSHNASEFSDSLPFSARGVPNRNGRANYITIKLNESGIQYLMWGGAYTGENVTSATEYTDLSDRAKLQKDVLLVDALQDEFRNMTYGELKSLFMNPNGTIKDGITVGQIDGNLCVTLSYSTVNSDGTVVTGDKKTNIYFKEAFEAAGFDTSLDDSNTYIINSVTTNTNTIWLNLRIKQAELKALKDSDAKWDQKASGAYTYVKSDGEKTPEELREINRKKN